MKKVLILLAILMVGLTSFAQTDAHLTFKGVPIDGTLDNFVKELVQKDFTLDKSSDTEAKLHGTFAGYSNCKLEVFTLKQKDLVSSVSVFFTSYKTWEDLYKVYSDLRGLLDVKYGGPTYFERGFFPADPLNNGVRMSYVIAKQCRYKTDYKLPKGDINLFITHDNMYGPVVVLKYSDKLNSGISRAQALEDL